MLHQHQSYEYRRDWPVGLLDYVTSYKLQVTSYKLQVTGAIGPSVYSIMFTAFGTAALVGPMVMSWLSEKGDHRYSRYSRCSRCCRCRIMLHEIWHR